MSAEKMGGDPRRSAGGTPVFVDYAPPAPPALLPPARYKLSLLVYCLVYLAVWFADEAGLPQFLTFNGWFSPDLALFLQLALTVFTLTFGTLDAVGEVFTFKRKGKLYGIGAWLKAPRSTWLLRYSNIFAESLAVVVRILEDGFCMFDGRKKSPTEEESQQFQCTNKEHVELRVEHRIDATKMEEYEEWSRKIKGVSARYAHGLVSVMRNEQILPSEGDDEKSIDIGADTKRESMLISTTLLFEDIDSLNEWMLSPRRKVMMAQLNHLLLTPNAERLRLGRVLPDAFTDLFNQQGQAPQKPPKKWKVWWLTLLALFISIKWTGSMLSYYWEFWGLYDEALQRLVSVAVTVFLNSYIIVPLLSLLFEPWMRRKRHEKIETKEPWRLLNEGFERLLWKCMLTLAFYGGCLIAWMVKAYA
ncbi:hypothetical protein ACHAXT_006516 [Thalassiosira profunda]